MVDKHIFIWYNLSVREVKIVRKSFTSTIDEDIQKSFKEKCNQVGLPQNVVLEVFMKEFSGGELELKMKKNKIFIDEKE